MKRLISIVICSLVMSIGLMASPASAEPHGYWMWCRDGSGNVSSVTNPMQCRQGYVKFIAYYDGRVVGGIDVYALEKKINRSYTLTMAYNDCNRRIVCGLIVAGVQALVLSKVKIAWTALRAIKLK